MMPGDGVGWRIQTLFGICIIVASLIIIFSGKRSPSQNGCSMKAIRGSVVQHLTT